MHACVCVCERERWAREVGCVSAYVCVSERSEVCTCMCVYLCEREMGCVRICVCQQ